MNSETFNPLETYFKRQRKAAARMQRIEREEAVKIAQKLRAQREEAAAIVSQITELFPAMYPILLELDKDKMRRMRPVFVVDHDIRKPWWQRAKNFKPTKQVMLWEVGRLREPRMCYTVDIILISIDAQDGTPYLALFRNLHQKPVPDTQGFDTLALNFTPEQLRNLLKDIQFKHSQLLKEADQQRKK